MYLTNAGAKYRLMLITWWWQQDHGIDPVVFSVIAKRVWEKDGDNGYAKDANEISFWVFYYN